jgi:hypothetical protein
VFGVLDVGHGLDRIVGFGGGDKIDLRVALPEHGPGDDIADFLRVRSDTGSTIISINPSGEGSPSPTCFGSRSVRSAFTHSSAPCS